MKKIIKTNTAPDAVGPYSQGVAVHPFIYLSGQIALTPEGVSKTNQPVEIQTKQVMQNLEALLKEAGCTFCNVIKTTIYLCDIQQFEKVNEIYGSYFTGSFPARSTVVVAELPKGAAVEIECIAYLDD